MRRRKVLIGVMVALLMALGLFFGGQKYGQKQYKPVVCPEVKCPEPIKEVKKLKIIKKRQPKVAKRQVVRRIAPPVTQVVVPNYGTTKLILRINVVEWAPVFVGKSLQSRDVGPVVRQGLANGTVIRTREQLAFIVNGASVVVRDGSAIVDPGPIGQETVMVVQPANGMRFASPPDGLPLTTNPGELDAVVRQGVSEIWMSFILAPPA